MQTTICPTCRGRKIMLQLGGMMGDCKRCLGVGHVSAEEIPLEQVTDIPTNEDMRKKAKKLLRESKTGG